MADIPGIQLSTKFSLNTSSPLDGKMRLLTSDRLSLSAVQRWLGMLVYDINLDNWKILINNPIGDTTTESDWDDFSSGSGGVSNLDGGTASSVYPPIGASPLDGGTSSSF